METRSLKRLAVVGLLAAVACEGAGASQRPNVLLVVLDTVRADRLSTYGYAHRTSPNLSALAARGARFDDVTAPSPWTLPSHASLMTGRTPAEHGATHVHRALSADAVTLAERFRAAGWRTAGFSTNPNVSAATRLDQGFERFSYTQDTGESVADAALTFVRQAEEPWLAFVNLMEAHMPYNALPEDVRLRYMPGTPQESRLVALEQQANAAYYACGARSPEPGDIARLGQLYDAALTHLDAVLGRLLDGLGDARARTLVVVTSDHGELLGEHGRVEHQFAVLGPLLRIPLVVAWPGRITPGTVVERPLDLADVHDMILHLAGLEQAPGDDPWGVAPRPYRVAEYRSPWWILDGVAEVDPACASLLDRSLTSVHRGRYKLVTASDGSRALYDLEADPGETEDVADRHPAIVAELEAIAAERRHRQQQTRAPDALPPVGPDVQERLEALGYVGAPGP